MSETTEQLIRFELPEFIPIESHNSDGLFDRVRKVDAATGNRSLTYQQYVRKIQGPVPALSRFRWINQLCPEGATPAMYDIAAENADLSETTFRQSGYHLDNRHPNDRFRIYTSSTGTTFMAAAFAVASPKPLDHWEFVNTARSYGPNWFEQATGDAEPVRTKNGTVNDFIKKVMDVTVEQLPTGHIMDGELSTTLHRTTALAANDPRQRVFAAVFYQSSDLAA